MQDLLPRVEWQVERLRTLVPTGAEFQSFLAQIVDQQISSVSPDTPMGIVPLSVLSKTKMLASARIAVELIDKPAQLAAKPEGIVDLGVIEWLLRPALPLKDGRLKELTSGPWKHLASDVVEGQSSGVCRLDVAIEGSDPIHIGTGFVAGEDPKGRFVIVTNAHVVEEVLRIGWPSRRGIVFGCDFARFDVTAGGELQELTEQYEIHPCHDMALLYLTRVSAVGGTTIRPLPIASTEPKEALERRIGVIGHPAFDSRLDPFPTFFGFGNEFGIKRFSPGLIRSLEEREWRGSNVHVLLHDATTLSGSSGSCIVDLGTMKVVGLHFGGWPIRRQRIVKRNKEEVIAQLFESNGAVPLWTLKDDPILRSLAFE